MNKKNLIRIVTALVIILAFGTWKYFQKPVEEKVHYHAGFKVFVDGNLQDFGKLIYMNDTPCAADKSKKVAEDPQLEKAHLHDLVTDVVHVHRDGAVWGDLFKNLKFEFPVDATVSGYLSGSKIENILEYPIKSYDSVIVTAGDETKADLVRYVTVDRIKEIEAKSESCAADK